MKARTLFLSATLLLAVFTVSGMRIPVPAAVSSPPSWKDIPLRNIVDLRYRDFLKRTQHRADAKTWVAFHFLKQKMRKEIKKDPAITAGRFMAIASRDKWALILVLLLVLLVLLFLVAIRAALPR